MNIFLITTIILIICSGVYVLLTRIAIRKLHQINIALQLAGQKAYKELGTLQEQYRQLANINQALRDISQPKKFKK